MWLLRFEQKDFLYLWIFLIANKTLILKVRDEICLFHVSSALTKFEVSNLFYCLHLKTVCCWSTCAVANETATFPLSAPVHVRCRGANDVHTSTADWCVFLRAAGGPCARGVGMYDVCVGVCRQAVLLGWSCLSIDIQICPENTNPCVRDQGLAWFQHNHFTVHAPLINKGAELHFISLF